MDSVNISSSEKCPVMKRIWLTAVNGTLVKTTGYSGRDEMNFANLSDRLVYLPKLSSMSLNAFDSRTSVSGDGRNSGANPAFIVFCKVSSNLIFFTNFGFRKV